MENIYNKDYVFYNSSIFYNLPEEALLKNKNLNGITEILLKEKEDIYKYIGSIIINKTYLIFLKNKCKFDIKKFCKNYYSYLKNNPQQNIRDFFLKRCIFFSSSRNTINQDPHCNKLQDIIFSNCFKRSLDKKDKRQKYKKSSVFDPPSTIHFGQRKLLLSEVEFLTSIVKDEKKEIVCLYVGAASGTHIPILSEMFPNVYFILFDPNPFSIKEDKNIKIINDYFTDEMAKEYSKIYNSNNLILISDIRTADHEKQECEEVEKWVKNDHLAQMKWIEILKPSFSLVKFRLPWNQKTFRYLKGTYYIQAFAPRLSKETRLTISSLEKKTYDCIKYEEQMIFFNKNSRMYRYVIYQNILDELNKKGKNKFCLDRCYDCTCQIDILKKYLLSKKIFSIENLISLLEKIDKYLRRSICRGNIIVDYKGKVDHTKNLLNKKKV